MFSHHESIADNRRLPKLVWAWEINRKTPTYYLYSIQHFEWRPVWDAFSFPRMCGRRHVWWLAAVPTWRATEGCPRRETAPTLFASRGRRLVEEPACRSPHDDLSITWAKWLWMSPWFVLLTYYHTRAQSTMGTTTRKMASQRQQWPVSLSS